MWCFSLLLAIFWTFTASAGQVRAVNVRAESAVLVNVETGRILYEKNAHIPRAPASITKIATAWYILECFSDRLEEKVVVSKNALLYSSPYFKKLDNTKYPSYHLEPKSTLMNLSPDEVVSVKTLLYGLMLISANDAANVLAEHFGGTIEQFIEQLNAFLKEKGCEKTCFTNPHGLHHVEHVTTASEMAHIAVMAMRNPIFSSIVSTVDFPCPASNKQPATYFHQTNRLLVKGKHFYPKAIGVKTGHTASAGFTLVAAAKHKERTLLTVLLGCKSVEDRYIDGKALFEAAFAEKKNMRTLLTKEHESFRFAPEGGVSLLEAVMHKNLTVEYYPSEEPVLRAEIQWALPAFPIHIGDRVGEVVGFDEHHKVICREALFAKNEVRATLGRKTIMFMQAVWRVPMAMPICVAVILVTCFALGVIRILRNTKHKT